MVDPLDDWLRKELKALPEMKAPNTVRPRVLAEVRRLESRPLARFRGRMYGGVRTAALGLAVAVVVWFVLSNPEQLAGEAFTNNPVFRLWELLATTLQVLLWHGKLYNMPVLAVLAALACASALACLAALTAVHLLSRTET